MNETFQYGGQAVIEGVMMRSPRFFAVACRRQDNQEIVLREEPVLSFFHRFKWLNKPFLRGTLALFEAMMLGMKSLSFSASIAMESETRKEAPSPAQETASQEPPKSINEIAVGLTMMVGLALGIGLFVMLPNALAGTLARWFKNPITLNLAEGALRLLIFLAYVGGISLMKDIQRVFQYHGAEHKVINTFEAGQPITLENALRQSRIHPRCGTSFILVVMLISILVFSCLGWSVWYWRILSRLALLPVVAGISYEIIRLAGRHKDAAWTRILLAPGLWSQYITTREPTQDQVEVAMKALEAVLEKERAPSKMALVP